ncbi:FAD-dependent oxidoreductase, partial [Chloroflexota bacterium]
MVQLTRLFEPGQIGKMELSNRLVMAPMFTRSHDKYGHITNRTIDYYVERVKGGVGLIIGQSSVILRETHTPGRSGIWDDSVIPRFRDLTDAIHKHGGKIAWQLMHLGKLLNQWRDIDPELRAIGPEEATIEDVERQIEGYGESARRLKEAGFNAVEIHGAHGYLISQWLSPLCNRRTDGYGSTAERRARFACEVIARVRQKVGADFPVILRFSGSGFLEGGITLEDSMRQAPLFVEAGVDALHVSAGETWSYNMVAPSYMFPDGALVHLAAAIKQVVNVPVITVGKIGDPLLAERILEDGKADFIAMGRALLADPNLPNKAKEGRLEDIQRCIYCNNCLNSDWRTGLKGQGHSCTVNPALLREKSFVIERTTSPKKVMVIGGGLAGMEAAKILAKRGHQVSLYERSDRLGGQWNIACKDEAKKHFASVTKRMSSELEIAGVEINLNREVTSKLVRVVKPDAVVVATGAVPRILNIPGIDDKNVVQAIDVLAGKITVGQKVVVIGGRLRGMELAVSLAEQGKRVSLVTMMKLGEPGTPLDIGLFITLRDRLVKNGVYIFTNTPVSKITHTGVYAEFGHGSV